MAHLRQRSLKSHILQALKISPLVGVLGQRQVGKTTLLKTIVGDYYVTLDDAETRLRADAKPKTFLSQFEQLTAIDECQKSPDLFTALKLRVQEFKKPGQFVLTGSVRFTSKKAIFESLTGRIFNLELLPMTLFEMRQLEPNDYLSWFHRKKYESLNKNLIQRQIEINKKHKDDYLTHGGLPGICFLREKSFRNGQMKSHIETLLQRDIYQISETTASYDSMFLLLQYLASHQGKSFVLKEAATYSRLSQVTVKKIISAFEGLFLIRRMVGFGFKNSPRFFLEDQGMAHYLAPVSNDQRMLRWILSQTFGNCHYSYMNQYQLGYFESKYSNEVPVVIKLGDQKLGFLFEDSESPSSNILKVAKEFTTHETNTKLLILGEYKQIVPLDSNILLCPWQWIS